MDSAFCLVLSFHEQINLSKILFIKKSMGSRSKGREGAREMDREAETEREYERE